MTAMNRVSLNNQIVSMRNDAGRAKLYTINKLVKNIKQLNERHGTEEQKSKFKRKSDRLLEEIYVIKKLKNDEVAKFFLTIQEDPSTILRKPEIDVNTRALAKICMNKFLPSSVLEFKKKYPNWKTEIPLLLPRLGDRYKNKYKCKLIKADPSVKNNLKNKINDSQLVNTPGNNGFLVENIKKRRNLEDSKAISGSHKIETLSNPNHAYENNYDNESFVTEKIDKKNSGIMKDCKKNVKKQKTNGESLQSKEKQKADEKNTKVVDPFFVTADNSEYMTVATSEKQIAALTNASDDTSFKTEKSFSFKKFNDNRISNNFKKNSDNNNFYAKKFNSKSDFKGKIDSQKPVPNEVSRLSMNENKREQLHPSWEAKKKQTSLVQFSGKKIVFGDD